MVADRPRCLLYRPFGIDLPYIVAGSSEASCSVFRWTIYRPFVAGREHCGITSKVMEKDHQIICKGKGGWGGVKQSCT